MSIAGSGGVIYYFSEQGSAAQHKLLLAEKKLPVIDASWGVEEEFLGKYARLFGKEIKRLEAESGLLFDHSVEVDEKWCELETQFKLIVGVEAKVVNFDPATMPAVLIDKPLNEEDKLLEHIGQKTGLSASQLRQKFAKMKQRKAEQDQMLLHLNMKNKLIQELRTMNRNDTFKLALRVVYYNALLLARPYLPAGDLETIFAVNNDAFTAMIRDSRRVEELESKIARMEIEFGEKL